MIDRLNLVASHAPVDLHEALTALCSWACVGRGQEENLQCITAFFESQALELLLQGFISANNWPVAESAKIGLSSLLDHLLPKSKSQIVSIVSALENLFSILVNQNLPKVNNAPCKLYVLNHISSTIRHIYHQSTRVSPAIDKDESNSAEIAHISSKIQEATRQLQLIKSDKEASQDSKSKQIAGLTFLLRELEFERITLLLQVSQIRHVRTNSWIDCHDSRTKRSDIHH